MSKIKVAVIGAAGRMGQEILTLIEDSDTMLLHSAIDRNNLKDMVGCDVAIDFTNREGTINNLGLYGKNHIPVVIGTTGFSAEELTLLQQAALHTTMFWSPNMALGPNLLAQLAQQAARTLGSEFAIDIIEAHHIHKKDAPSGTALMIGNNIDDKVTYHSIRGGDIIGEHSVKFSGPGEQIILSHQAQNRSIFARGALAIAKWLITQKPGKLYNYQDFLSTDFQTK